MIIYNTGDSPLANGRKPQPGDVMFPISFVLDDGEVLKIQMGQKGFDTITNLLMDMLSNAPCHDDGSVPGPSQVAFISSGNTEQDEARGRDIQRTEERLHARCCPNGCGPMMMNKPTEHECSKCHFVWGHEPFEK